MRSQNRVLISVAVAFGCVALMSRVSASPTILRFADDGTFLLGRNQGKPVLLAMAVKSSRKLQDCEILEEKDAIDDVLRRVPAKSVVRLSDDDLTVYLVSCINALSGQPAARTLDDVLQKLVIYPGTKWCGSGNIAENYNDLGKARSTDKCCREHDHSKDNIPGRGERHGIKNTNPYTMTNCKDDRKFYNCLLNHPSRTSGSVGALFFDVLQTSCFAKALPVKCVQEEDTSSFLDKLIGETSCRKYIVEKSAPKIWQEFPPPSFSRDYIDKWGHNGSFFLPVATREHPPNSWKLIK